jgi:hypothetical protein
VFLSQNDGQQNGQAGKGPTAIHAQLQVLVELSFQPVNVVPAQYGKPQQQQGQLPDNNGQANIPVIGQGDSQNGPTNSSDDGSGNLLDNSQSDQAVSLDPGQSGQSDSGESGGTESSSQGEGGPTSTTTHDGNHCHRTANGSSEDQSNEQATPVDLSQSDPAGQGTTSSQNGASQGSTILGSSSESKTSSSAEPLTGNPDVPSVAEPGTAISAEGNSQSGSPDRRQHGPSNASLLEVEQHSPSSAQEGKQHGPDGTVATADETHGVVAMRSQGADQRNHNQADGQGQQQTLTDDPPQRPLFAERLRGVDALRGTGTTETPSSPGEDAVFVGDFPEDTTSASESMNVSPQKHGLLTDSLSLEIASLRSQVQRFFEHIDQLGAQTTDRQTGLVLCSVAVVAAAAMACEVAWRQARRPVANAPLALASPLAWADDAEAPAAIGLPYVGQFSTLS